MPTDLYIYAKPAETIVELLLDNGTLITAETSSANGRDDAHHLPIPDGMTGQGATLTVPGYVTPPVRGLVLQAQTDVAVFWFDDFGDLVREDETPAPEPEPPGPPHPEDAESVVYWVYETQVHDLSTHGGCGIFTEAVCQALHDYNSPAWMHDKRTPPQNNYNGHAVDAVQAIAGPYWGMYDIIKNSISPDATPCFNRAGDPNPPNAYYPA